MGRIEEVLVEERNPKNAAQVKSRCCGLRLYISTLVFFSEKNSTLPLPLALPSLSCSTRLHVTVCQSVPMPAAGAFVGSCRGMHRFVP